jgi:hypothetical protein
MKFDVVLNGRGGELARLSCEVHDEDDSCEISEQIHDAIYSWVLSPGDTIVITEG